MSEPSHLSRGDRIRRRKRERRRRLIIAASSGALVAAIAVVALTWPGGQIVSAVHGSTLPQAHSTAQTESAPQALAAPVYFRPLSATQVAALPEARYDAVIPGLLPYASDSVPAVSRSAYTISTDTPIYDDARTPVARFAFVDFTGRPTVIVPVRFDGPWALVMTPARRQLPSAAGGQAPAQTAGWVRIDALRRTGDLASRVVVSVGRQKLFIQSQDGTVQATFDVAVGAPGTPTPTGVTGYLEERYLDRQQGQATYPIQLTSLHSAAQDEPFQGEDGGLIGMHFFPQHSGDVSHGCIRLSAVAVQAVSILPLGTSVTMSP